MVGQTNLRDGRLSGGKRGELGRLGRRRSDGTHLDGGSAGGSGCVKVGVAVGLDGGVDGMRAALVAAEVGELGVGFAAEFAGEGSSGGRRLVNVGVLLEGGGGAEGLAALGADAAGLLVRSVLARLLLFLLLLLLVRLRAARKVRAPGLTPLLSLRAARSVQCPSGMEGDHHKRGSR